MSNTNLLSTGYRRTEVSRWTEAQMRSIGGKILDDLHLAVGRRLLAQSSALSWYEVVSFLLINHGAERLEIQFTAPEVGRTGLRYLVFDEGPPTDMPSGGLDLYPYPNNTQVSVVAGYNTSHPQLTQIREKIQQLGWVHNGSFLEGDALVDRVYMHGPVGVLRQRIGRWP